MLVPVPLPPLFLWYDCRDDTTSVKKDDRSIHITVMTINGANERKTTNIRNNDDVVGELELS